MALRIDDIPLRPAPKRTSWIVRYCQMWLRPFLIGCFDYRVQGLHHLPQSGGCLIIANHQSYLDPVLVGTLILRPICFFAKAYLFRVPLFGRLLPHLFAFPVQHGKGDRGAIEQAIQHLREGYLLCIYPEGTRTADGEIAALQGGASLLVRKAGVPVVPAIIDGSFKAWPRKSILFRSHPIRVRFGPPLNLDGLKSSQITELMDQTLRQMLTELRSEKVLR